MSEELKPCPFCGCANVEYLNGWGRGSRDIDKSDGRSPSIGCAECLIGMSVAYFGRGYSDDDAEMETAQAWNKRTPH